MNESYKELAKNLSQEQKEFFINNLITMTKTERKVFNRGKALERIHQFALNELLAHRILQLDYFKIDDLCRSLMD